jgi:hypothetical protein
VWQKKNFSPLLMKQPTQAAAASVHKCAIDHEITLLIKAQKSGFKEVTTRRRTGIYYPTKSKCRQSPTLRK